MRASVTAFGEWCAEQGMPLSYHHHMAAVVETEPELDAFMKNSGAGIPLLLDAGHLAFAGGDVLRAIDNHHARINHVHVKDVRMDGDRRARPQQAILPRRGGARRLHRAGRRLARFRRHRPEASPTTAMKAGSWSRPSRIRARHPPLRMAEIGHEELMRVMTAAGYTVETQGFPT